MVGGQATTTVRQGERVQQLRPIVHPGQADTLVHFCGRARPTNAPEVAFLSPEERLSNIVAEEVLRAHPTFGNPNPVVCFSESDHGGVEALLRHFQFEGWGVIVERQWAWSAGGGPVWYARSEMWERVCSQVDRDALAFIVRTEAGSADWLHEREWRVPCSSGELPLISTEVVALLVSDPDWEPRPVPHYVAYEGGVWADVTPRLACSVPRWLWNGNTITELPPLDERVEIWPVQP